MTIDINDCLNSILSSFSRIEHVKAEDIPNIELYMDQVTTFMESHLSKTKRYKDDKILTKTMINNYAKNNLLPPPNKKKYSKEHMLILIFIYHFKSVLSITDIQTLLNPLTEKYFNTNDDISIERIYSEVFSMEESQVEALKEDIRQQYKLANHTFQDVEGDEGEFLQIFSFICALSFDVFMKRLLIEKLIDELRKDKK